MALLAALTDRRKSVLAANALYGATTTLLTKVLEPLGVEVDFVDICDLGGAGATDRRIEARLHRSWRRSRIRCCAWAI